MHIKMKFSKLIFASAIGAMLFPMAVSAYSLPEKSAVYESFESGSVFSGLDVITESDGNKAARIKNTLTDIVYTPVKDMILEGSFTVEERGADALFEIIPSSNPRGDTYFGGERATVFSVDLSRGFMRIGRYIGEEVGI